jgi:O-antigen/teichoic acid export membrane protein
MSRIRKAAITAGLTYVQFGLAIAGSLVLIPLAISFVGARHYGLWLATGELLGYAAMADFGVLGVLPWMLAEADGRRDRDGMRALVANGVVVGAAVGAGYAVLVAILWSVLPAALDLTADDRAVVGPALALIACAAVIGYPLRVFNAVLAGLQDAAFNGALGIAQSALSFGIAIAMLLNGYGILSLAAAAAGSSLVIAIASLLRSWVIAPELFTRWPRPSVPAVRLLLSNGLGGWLGAFGWQMLNASTGLVIAFVGHPEWVAVYAVTAKLGTLGTQLAWVLPDSGLVGLAQLQGEAGSRGRVQHMVRLLLRLHLLLAGGAACAVLAFNPAFVKLWVGPAFFGGLKLNALLAAAVLLQSYVHGLLTVASVVGNRLRAGAAVLANGVSHLACAILLGSTWELQGIAAAALVTGLLTSVPAGVLLLRTAVGLEPGSTLGVVWAWAPRMAPIAMAAALVGVLSPSWGFGATLGATLAVGGLYLWVMRPLFVDLPLDPRWSRWLVSLRVIPDAPQVAPAKPS